MGQETIEPSQFHGGGIPALASPPSSRVTFERKELDRIFSLYGRKVAAGEWRDYAIDFLRDRAVFSVFRRASEVRSIASRKIRSWRGDRAPIASSPRPA